MPVSARIRQKFHETYRHVNRDQAKPNESQCIRPLGTLGPITNWQRKQETQDEKPQVKVIQNEVRVMQMRDVALQGVCDDHKGNVVVALAQIRLITKAIQHEERQHVRGRTRRISSYTVDRTFRYVSKTCEGKSVTSDRCSGNEQYCAPRRRMNR
jgi:hypothetical protein